MPAKSFLLHADSAPGALTATGAFAISSSRIESLARAGGRTTRSAWARMQLPVQADPPEVKELAEKLRAIEPPVAEGCDGSEIERDRGKLIAAIIAILLAVKNFIEAVLAYQQHWPKGPRGRWGRAFKLIASSLGSSTRTLYRFIESIAKGVVPDRKRKRKVERPDGDGKAKRIGEKSGAQTAQSPDRVAKPATEDLKDRFGDALVRQLYTRANAEPTVDLVDRLGKMIEMSLPEDGRTEEARKIMVALATRLGIS